MMADLSSLIARVEAASGPDREIDCLIAVAVDGFWIERRPYLEPAYCHTHEGETIMPGQAGDMLVPAYTASLDAAVALCERVLPGWFYTVARHYAHPVPPDKPFYADIASKEWIEGESKTGNAEAFGSTLALAMVSALLRALPPATKPGSAPAQDHD